MGVEENPMSQASQITDPVVNSSANWLRAAAFAMVVFVVIGGQLAWGGVTGSISGVIRDSSGAVVPGVQVAAHNIQTGLQWSATTDTQGFYSLQALPVGTYEISADKN